MTVAGLHMMIASPITHRDIAARSGGVSVCRHVGVSNWPAVQWCICVSDRFAAHRHVGVSVHRCIGMLRGVSGLQCYWRSSEWALVYQQIGVSGYLRFGVSVNRIASRRISMSVYRYIIVPASVYRIASQCIGVSVYWCLGTLPCASSSEDQRGWLGWLVG